MEMSILCLNSSNNKKKNEYQIQHPEIVKGKVRVCTFRIYISILYLILYCVCALDFSGGASLQGEVNPQAWQGLKKCQNFFSWFDFNIEDFTNHHRKNYQTYQISFF